MQMSLGAWALAAATAIASAAGLSQACAPGARASAPTGNERPNLRLFIASDLAGALEPCGCREDMLGGLDHAAALLTREARAADAALLVGAGPLLSLDPVPPPERHDQDLAKAEAIATALGSLGLVAWTPGYNDWGFGGPTLAALWKMSGASLLAANLRGAPAQAWQIVDRGGIRLGLAGVSLPLESGKPPPGVEVEPAEAALAAARTALEQQGAQLFVALVAVPRGEALRLAERVHGFQLMVVGKPAERGTNDDAVTPPTRVGETVVVQAPNHLQGIAVFDVYVKDRENGPLTLADPSGVTRAEARESLAQRIAELERRIATWERTPGVSRADVDARRRDLERLRAERDRDLAATPPERGSWFRYELLPVRESAGVHPRVAELIFGTKRAVNEHNRVALAGRIPPPVAEGENHYVGGDACVPCHEPAHRFWDQTRHSGAYYTLVAGYSEYNLECVGCHVTGYEKPGGSTVTHVNELAAVQCEACHGPGSRHSAEPGTPGLVVRTPPKTLCAESCHHPPHVAPDWSVEEAWKKQIGPGHGVPLEEDLAGQSAAPETALPP